MEAGTVQRPLPEAWREADFCFFKGQISNLIATIYLVLVCSLSSHRHSDIPLSLALALSIHNKQPIYLPGQKWYSFAQIIVEIPDY
jgi:hypothetical protein